MTAPTLTREAGATRCSKCNETPERAARVAVADWTLRRDGREWRLCTNHAAAACQSLNLEHPVFRPAGAV